MASYRYSSLRRFLEEALAEGYGQLRGSGIRDAVGALRFPIQRNYVYLLRRSGFDPDMMGLGVVPELLGLAAGAIQIDGVWHDIHLGPGAAQPAAADELASPGDAHEANGS